MIIQNMTTGLVRVVGVEPTSTASQTQCFALLSYTHKFAVL